MRAFIAAEIPGEIKRYLKGVSMAASKYTDGVKWVQEKGQHLTLKFLGEIGEVMPEKIKDAIGPVGSIYPPVTFTLKGMDAFPNRKKARVIVVTLENGVDIIKDIFNYIEERLSPLGFEREKRGFRPHITLGRRRTPAPLLEKAIMDMERMSFTVDRIILFKSLLRPEGASYTPVWEIKLRGENDLTAGQKGMDTR